MVYDETHHRELASIDCGGPHRVWSFSPSPEDGSSNSFGSFSWVRATDLHWAFLGIPASKLIKPGGHGREIKACAVRPQLFNISGHACNIIATGAEDTDIRLFSYSDAQYQAGASGFTCLSVMKKHNTGIQHLQWSADGAYLFSSGGQFEFFVWRIREVPLVRVGVVCEFEYRLPLDSDLPDLRITSFEARSLPEIECFDVCVALSDSSTRLYRYECARRDWTLRWESRYTDICLTQVFFLGLDSSELVAAAASDGHIAIWNTGAVSNAGQIKKIKVHQSAIKACQLIPFSGTNSSTESCLVVTAGDDNGLCFTVVSWTNDTEESTVEAQVLSIPRAHAASISALAVLPGERHDTEGRLQKRIASAGNDQRVKLWEIAINPQNPDISSLDVRRIASWFTPVADVGDMSVLPNQLEDCPDARTSVVVCGVGMEVLCISDRDA